VAVAAKVFDYVPCEKTEVLIQDKIPGLNLALDVMRNDFFIRFAHGLILESKPDVVVTVEIDRASVLNVGVLVEEIYRQEFIVVLDGRGVSLRNMKPRLTAALKVEDEGTGNQILFDPFDLVKKLKPIRSHLNRRRWGV
jgi:hypothetical protein